MGEVKRYFRAAELGVDLTEVVEAMIAGAGFKACSIDAKRTVSADGSPLADRLGGLDPGISFIEDREALRVQLATLAEGSVR